ncbi:MFS transporter [Streptomyces sp. NPDC052676]|uniref:MFS transporter n=1 Tax=Streptomyces sp. NPDC052676 TaxID=3154953 RepID=UPI003440F490
MTAARGPSARRATGERRPLPPVFWLLFAGTLLNRLGILVPAFLALFLAAETGLSTGAIGVLVGLWGAGSVAGALLGGALADRVGPRAAVLFSQAVSLAASVCLVCTQRAGVLAGVVLLSGCASTLHKPAGAVVVSRELPETAHVRAFGLLYWASNIGAAVSPAVSGVLLEWDPVWLIVLNMVTAVCYGAVALRLPGADGHGGKEARAPGRGLLAPFRSGPVARFLVLSFCLALIYLQKQSTLPLDMAAHGLAPHVYGLVASLNGLLIIVLQPFVSRAAERLGMDTQFVLAGLLVAVGFGANAIAGSAWSYATALTVWTLGEILLVPQASAFLVRHAPEGRAGSYQGAYQFVWNLGLVLGAPLGMSVRETWGGDTLWAGCLALGAGVVTVYAGYAVRDGARRPARRDGARGRGRSEGAGRSEGLRRSEGAGRSEGQDRSEGLRRSDGPGRSEASGRSEGQDRSEGLRRSDGPGQSDAETEDSADSRGT